MKSSKEIIDNVFVDSENGEQTLQKYLSDLMKIDRVVLLFHIPSWPKAANLLNY